MFVKKILFSCWIFLMSSSLAHAKQPSKTCNVSDIAYQRGLAFGQQQAQEILNGINDCSHINMALDELKQGIKHLPKPQRRGSAQHQCVFAGAVDGYSTFLADILTECEQCGSDGSILALIYAQAYCELSIALDGLVDPENWFRPPTSLCGKAFQLTCDATFSLSATTYVNDEGARCSPYTVDRFLIVHNNTRDLVCTFEDLLKE
jgi:hypothetical protein